MDSGRIPVELICIPADSGLIPVDSSGFRRNPVIPAGMVGGVTSTAYLYATCCPAAPAVAAPAAAAGVGGVGVVLVHSKTPL